jgi:hypothetical protein
MPLMLPIIGLGVALLFTPAMPTPAAEPMRLRVGGVEMQARHARGAEAIEMIRAHLASHPLAVDGTPARWTAQSGWRVLASREGGISRVLQVRGEGDDTEAVLSTLDPRQPRRDPPRAPLWLPPGTRVTGQVEALDAAPSRQWIARSTWSTSGLRRWLDLAMRGQGWEGEGLELRSRGSERLHVVVLPAPPGAKGSVAVITTWGRRPSP